MKLWFWALVPLLASFVVYRNVFPNEFLIGDEEHTILRNPYLRDWNHFPKFFTENMKAGYGQATNYYRPLQMVLFAFLTQTFGYKTWAFHFFPLLFHGLSGLFLYLLLRRLFSKEPLWLMSLLSALWVAHPIHTVEVALATGLGEPMKTAFLLMALWAFLKAVYGETGGVVTGKLQETNTEPSSPKPQATKHPIRVSLGYYLLSLGAFVCSLLSKESGIVLPPLLLAVHITLMRTGNLQKLRLRNFLLLHLPFWLIAGLYVALRLTVLNFAGTLDFYAQPNIFTENFLYRLWTLATVLAYGIGLLLTPVGLHPERSWPVYTELFSLPVLWSLVLLAALCVVAVYFWRSKPLVSLGIFWFFVAYFPTSNLVAKINALFWEHWFYLPGIGVLIALMAWALSSPRLRNAFIFASFSGAVIFSGITIARTHHFRNSETYYEHILQYEPGKAKLWTNLGIALANKGENLKAIECYKRAIALEDTYPETRHNLGNSYLALGVIAEAEQEFLRAIQINPNFYHSYISLANIALARGEVRKAVPHLEKALVIFPELAEVKKVLEEIKRQ